MPLQNRVTPLGELVATSHRGTMYGVRGGCFHRDDQTLKPRHWAGKNWIVCELDYKGRQRKMMQPGLYTELFFLDEATAFAAGHRPCFFCRRADAQRYQRHWSETIGQGFVPRANEMDLVLHEQRTTPTAKRVTRRPADLPDGAIVLQNETPQLVIGGTLRPWSFAGYGPPFAVAEPLTVLTPPATLAILAAGYRPRLHPTAPHAQMGNDT